MLSPGRQPAATVAASLAIAALAGLAPTACESGPKRRPAALDAASDGPWADATADAPLDRPARPDADTCPGAVSCAPGGPYLYCGVIGDGCGGRLDCGACPSGQVCDLHRHLCKPERCVPAADPCRSGASTYCGIIGDGCGGAVDCGTTCPEGLACGANVPHMCGRTNCIPQHNCFGAEWFCGRLSDGCQGSHECDCGEPWLACDPVSHVCRLKTCTSSDSGESGCGAATLCGLCQPNACAAASCGNLSCDAPGGRRYCGRIFDDCECTLECGACEEGFQCNDVHICVPAGCAPNRTCRGSDGATYCGPIDDGCGHPIDCPACPGGQTCGSVVRSVCDPDPSLTPPPAEVPVLYDPWGPRHIGAIWPPDGDYSLITPEVPPPPAPPLPPPAP